MSPDSRVGPLKVAIATGRNHRSEEHYGPPARMGIMARIPYVDPEDLPAERRELVVSALQDRPLHVYRALGTNDDVLAGLREYFGTLWTDTGLSTREREVVILTVAGAIDSDYEWHQHVRIARGEGFDDATIAAIGAGRFEELSEPEASLARYARAVVDRSVDDALHAAIAEHYDDETIVGTAALATAYQGLGGIIDALDLELEAGETFFGWDPRAE